MKLYLVRHGETDKNANGFFYGWTDCDINKNGIRQAKALQEFFKDIPIDEMYASDLLRASHTADIIRGEREIPYLRCNCFRELYYGDWEDKPASYIKENFADELKGWHSNWMESQMPNGETFEEFYTRVTQGLDALIAGGGEKTVVLVSHNGPMSAMLCHLTGAGAGSFWRFPSYQGCFSSVNVIGDRILIDKINCSVE